MQVNFSTMPIGAHVAREMPVVTCRVCGEPAVVLKKRYVHSAQLVRGITWSGKRPMRVEPIRACGCTTVRQALLDIFRSDDGATRFSRQQLLEQVNARMVFGERSLATVETALGAIARGFCSKLCSEGRGDKRRWYWRPRGEE